MRTHLLFLFLIAAAFTLSGNRVLCEPQAAEAPVGTSPSQARMQWMRDTTVLAYDAAGKKNPKWDDLARRTLEAAGRTWGRSPRRNGDEDMVVMFSSQAAIKAGCRDPLVIYARARSITFYQAKPAEVAKLQEGMAEAFRAGKYPAIRKCYGLLRAAQVQVMAAPDDQKTRDSAQVLVEEAMGLVPEVFADPRLPRQELVAALKLIGEVSEIVEGTRDSLRDRAMEIMEKSIQPKAAILTARGEIAIFDGWHARGDGFANTVTPEGWRILQERMAKGRENLNEAWALDPNDFEVARMQLDAETHDSHGRDAMEKWFDAATKIDPDDFRAYMGKLNWLEPKWHGSPDEMLAFGRECAATGRWSGCVPLVLVDAHWAIGRYGGQGYPPAPHKEYFQTNPKVWEEIKPIYDRYLKEQDASNFHRTRYAVIAAYSGHWKEANALFKSIPSDRRAMDVLYDNSALDALVKEATKEARKLLATERAARAAAGNPLPANDIVVSARWGGGQKWVDVTATLKEWLTGDDDTIRADNDTLGSDPTPGWQKHLEITYKKDGEQKTISITENEKVPMEKLRP